MADHSALRRIRSRGQRGQAAVEFVFCMILVIGLAAALFQALQFERDVFNKSLMARYQALKDIHDSPDDKDPETIRKTIEGKQLSELVPYTIPGQEIDGSLHYGPKKFSVRRGTKRWDPAEALHSAWAFAGILTVDHYEDSAGYVGDMFGYLSQVTNLLN
jgi:hypothetical protein